MAYLHETFGAHGNLKSSNCLLDGRWNVKITDFFPNSILQQSYVSSLKDVDKYEERKLECKCLFLL